MNLLYDSRNLMYFLSNGHSTANLLNSSTRRKFAIFVEFESSPKWSFWKIGRTRRHLPNPLPSTRQTCQHSPSRLPSTRQTRRHSPNRLPRTRQTRVLREFGKFVEFGEFGKCRVDRFIHKNMFLVHQMTYLITYSHTSETCRHSPNSLPRTRQTRRHSPNHLPSTRQTRRHLPNRLPSTRQTCRHLPRAIFEKNVTRLDTFARVIRYSREFGASGHCLVFPICSFFKVSNIG